MCIFPDLLLLLGSHMLCHLPAVLLIGLSQRHIRRGQARDLLFVQRVGAQDAGDGAPAQNCSRDVGFPTIQNFLLRGIAGLAVVFAVNRNRVLFDNFLRFCACPPGFNGRCHHAYRCRHRQNGSAVLAQELRACFRQFHCSTSKLQKQKFISSGIGQQLSSPSSSGM